MNCDKIQQSKIKSFKQRSWNYFRSMSYTEFKSATLQVEIFWVVKGYWRFRGPCCLYLQGEVTGDEKNGHRYRTSPVTTHWSWRQHRPLKCWYPTAKLHGITTQKTLSWIFTTMKTSNLTSRFVLFQGII